MPNNNMISSLCALGVLALFGCGDPAAFDAPLATDPEEPQESLEDGPEEVPEAGSSEPIVMAFDVTEDLTRFAFDDEGVDDDTLPEHGASFVTQGYIYPYGFLVGREGTDENGAPAHPDHVIGEWTSHGYVVGDGVANESGAWAVSTHIYDFYETPGYAEGKEAGGHTLVSEGYELTQEGLPFSRSITGATGLARDARGELQATLHGTNASGGVNLRLYLFEGFAPIIASEDLPELPRRDFQPCNWDLFGDERCDVF